MSIIVMAVHSTRDNGRIPYTKRTLNSLLQTVDFNKHQLFISDNGSCKDMRDWYSDFKVSFGNAYTLCNLTVCLNKENLGTAKAVNLGLFFRREDQYAIKCDDDVVIRQKGWVEEMEEAMIRDESIGILGLKRKDLAETPNSEIDYYRSTLHMLPHEAGQKWIVVEECKHIMGTCQMLSPKLIEKLGYFFQNGQYGLDDSDLSYRSTLAGFRNVFLPHIEIEHLDDGSNDYCKWKQDHAGIHMEAWGNICEEYRLGIRPLYYDGGFEA